MLRFKDLLERINIARTKMGDVIKDFQDSDAPQFKGKSMEKRRQMAIAAKLEADRGVKEEVEELDEISAGKAIRTAVKREVGVYGKAIDAGDEPSKRGLDKIAKNKARIAKKYGDKAANIAHRTAGKRLGYVGEDIEQTDEELKGNQHKIDANKNGKIDGHDFKILRNAKKARYQ